MLACYNGSRGQGGGAASKCGTTNVIDLRFGDVADAPTAQMGALLQVELLEEREEAAIESA